MVRAEVVVNPEISRRKFEREIADYRRMEDIYIERGWFLLKAAFPEVFVVFATPVTAPPTVVIGAAINFENYDFWPPSVTLANPFTRQPYLMKNLPVQMPRIGAGIPPDLLAQLQAGLLPPGFQLPLDNLLQSASPEDKPFLCVPGVREYHNSPAHSGDSWLLHRGKGEGTLHFIIETIYKYAIKSIVGFHVQPAYKIQLLQRNIAQ